MMRLDSDFVDLIEAGIEGRLNTAHAQWNPRPSLAVVMAAANYPNAPRNGDVIHGLDAPQIPDSKVFHAGTRVDGDTATTAGGRVLTVCALGDSVGMAQACAYRALAQISWDGEFHRSDIGWRAIAREQADP
jgi:phosphoribosylamine--glycine ligase